MTEPAPLSLQSERYRATGNLASEGMQNQLGRPRLDQLTVLIRESIQNSWDACAPGRPSISYDLRLQHATDSQRDFLRQFVFASCPVNLGIQDSLTSNRPLPLLTLSDRGTTGLGGLTRADVVVAADDDTPQDFVDFLRNIGQPPDKSLGGGTFGYGKAALYQVSRHRTILVYTRCYWNGKLQTRFMVAALGFGFTVHTKGSDHGRYTGRHWWGRQENELVEPLLDADADAIATGLGMPCFKGEELGTSIMILDFDPGQGRTVQVAMDVMLESLIWNLWPKLVPPEGGLAPIRFTANLHGQPVPIPDLTQHYPLKGYTDALRSIRRSKKGKPPTEGTQVFEITYGKGKKRLGWLAICRLMRIGRIKVRNGKAATGRPEGDRNHHIALMRSAELVVRYGVYSLIQSDLLEYVGVFVASDEVSVDRAFAASEPPTHDDWVVETLNDRNQASYVRVGLRKLRDTVEDFVSPTTGDVVTGEQTPLGAISSFMGEILTGLPGPGGDKAPVRVTARSKPSVKNPDPVVPEDSQPSDGVQMSDIDPVKPGATFPLPKRIGRPKLKATTPRLDVVGGVALLMMDVTIKHGIHSTGTRITVSATALLDGGTAEKEAPAGAAVPEVHLWRKPDGTTLNASGPTLEIPYGDKETWQVGVRLIDDAEVKVSIQGEALE